MYLDSYSLESSSVCAEDVPSTKNYPPDSAETESTKDKIAGLQEMECDLFQIAVLQDSH